MKSKILNILVFLIVILTGWHIAYADESIDSFDVNITINQEATFQVVETISYNFDANEKHGIYRNIPVIYSTQYGRTSIALKNIQVTDANGIPYSFTTFRQGNDEQIKIGDADVFVTGVKSYVLSYTVENAITYTNAFDELYWNVTGNDWNVPIAGVAVDVALPSEGAVLQASCYEGMKGGTANCQSTFSSSEKTNAVSFTSNNALAPNEGLTIAVGFPKGTITEPTKFEKVLFFLKNNFLLMIPLFVLLIMLLIWYCKGRDPKSNRPIIAEYEPPEGFKPALVGSLIDERVDGKDITAGLIGLAQAGFVRITRIPKVGVFGHDEYELQLLKEIEKVPEKTEQSILKAFFDGGVPVGYQQRISDLKKDTVFAIKIKKIKKDIYADMVARKLFINNPFNQKMKYVGAGVLIIFLSGYALAFRGALSALAVVLSGVIVIIFSRYMSKKTVQGVEIKRKILGFKLYLSVTDKERFAFHDAPEKSPEQFMQYLPYAIALDVEKKWAEQFKDIYMPAPSWYNDQSMTSGFVIGNFVSGLSDFKTYASASMMPQNSSGAVSGIGSGGGGFSGGGFGGGGGGSW